MNPHLAFLCANIEDKDYFEHNHSLFMNICNETPLRRTENDHDQSVVINTLFVL